MATDNNIICNRIFLAASVAFFVISCEFHKTSYNIKEWIGNYSLDTITGQDPIGGAVQYQYNLLIKKDSILFSGIGYQTYFTDFCTANLTKDTLYISFQKNISGSDEHGQYPPPFIKVYRKNNHIFMKTRAINFQSESDIKLKKDN